MTIRSIGIPVGDDVIRRNKPRYMLSTHEWPRSMMCGWCGGGVALRLDESEATCRSCAWEQRQVPTPHWPGEIPTGDYLDWTLSLFAADPDNRSIPRVMNVGDADWGESPHSEVARRRRTK
jgi:hypothetical protein